MLTVPINSPSVEDTAHRISHSMPSHLCENRMAKLTLPVQGGSLPSPLPPPLSGLCSLPQHREGQAEAPSPGPGRPPQDVKKIFSKQPGGRLGLALRRTPSFVEGFPLLPPFLGFLATTGPSSLAAASFSSTVTVVLSLPRRGGGWGCTDCCLLALMGGLGKVPGLPCLGLHTGNLSVACSVVLPPGIGATWAQELGGPASVGGVWVEQGGPRNQTQGLFFWANFEQICLLACGGCAWYEEVRGGLWVEPRDSHSGNSHLASHVPSPLERGVTPGAQAFPCECEGR